MVLTFPHDTGPRRPLDADPGNGPSGPLVWQRTDTVGTELVFQAGSDPRAATGSAVIAGPLPYTTRWSADLDTDWQVQALTVACEGGNFSRTLELTRDPEGSWTCRTETTGNLGRSLAGSGHSAAPLPGIEDASRLQPQAIVRLSDSPIFLTWALRRLRLTPGDQPVCAPSVRILAPSLAVLAGISTYQLVSEQRLRVSGDVPAAGYELDRAGIVTYQPARFRLVR
jgi:uncharacterized protein